MWLIFISLWMHIAQADCDFEPGPQDAELLRAPAAGVVIFEIRLTGQAPPPTAILSALSEHDIQATVLASASWSLRHPEALAAAAASGHEVGYWVSLREDLSLQGDMATPPALAHWVKSLRRARRSVRAATKQPIRTIGIQTLPNIGEIAIEGLGFRVILPAERTIQDQPRRSESLHSAAGRARILGIGPYADGCGAVLPAWTPAALDRAARVAQTGSWVRVALPSDPSAAPLLSRWLDEVVVPEGWNILTADQAARKAKPRLGAPTAAQKQEPSSIVRTVDWKTFQAAATTLEEATTLPRELPGGLNPTEMFMLLAQTLASGDQPKDVSLAPLQGPLETARNGLGAKTIPLSAEDVRTAARELVPGLTGHIPSIVSVGAHSLTAAEFLRAMALTQLGKDVHARAVADPDPYAPGGGWGTSGSR